MEGILNIVLTIIPKTGINKVNQFHVVFKGEGCRFYAIGLKN